MAETNDRKKQQPNVIVFFTDQQRWDTAGVHGNPLRLTPNFDRMAKEGTWIKKSFTCQPVCGPARSCLQTGLYATTSGCHVNGIPLPEGSRTLAHEFREAGYRTGYIGKWHLAGEEPVTEPKRGGYEYWLGSELLEFTSDAYDTVLFNGNNEKVKLPGYRVDAMTDASIRFIDEHQDHPFFLFVSYLEPHHQNHRDDYPAPDVYSESYIDRWTPPDLATLGGTSAQHLPGYYGMVKRLDDALGRMLDALKSLGLSENTIIMYTSDHGNHFKTRNNEYKRSPHDSAIRVPTAFAGPGFDGGGTMRELVSLIDLPPTLLDAAGLPVPERMQGKSLMPLVRKQSAAWSEEVFIQISESQVGRAIRTDRWKYAVHAPHKDAKKDPGSDHYQELYLYDLKADPYELNNLVGMESYRAIADELLETLLRRMNEAGEPPAQITQAEVKPAQHRRAENDQLFRDFWQGKS